MGDGKDYVLRLMWAKCSCGTIENRLNIDMDHGVVSGAEKEPLLNANDHSDKNVIHFGSCKSDGNPERNFRKGLVGGLLGGPLFGGFIADALEDIGLLDCKCTPNTPLPWINGNENHLIEGAPSLTLNSKLACMYGGEISILSAAEQEAKNKPAEETKEEENQAPEEEAKPDVVKEGAADAFAQAKAKVEGTKSEGSKGEE